MDKIIFFWGIGSFVFFKIAFDAVFNRCRGCNDMSVIAAALLGVMVAISVYYTNRFYVEKFAQRFSGTGTANKSSLFSGTAHIWLSAAAVNVLIGKSVIWGFSRELDEDLYWGDWYWMFKKALRGNPDRMEDFNSFISWVLLLLLPVTLHYSIKLWGKYVETTGK